MVIILSVLSIGLFLKKILRDKLELRINLEKTRVDLNYWKEKSASFIQGLSIEIDQQFENWKLTKSEKEVAILLIKGLSTRKISSIRGTADKTVRAQTSSIYKKSQVANRNELTAFFLEDLLVPSGQ